MVTKKEIVDLINKFIEDLNKLDSLDIKTQIEAYKELIKEIER